MLQVVPFISIYRHKGVQRNPWHSNKAHSHQIPPYTSSVLKLPISKGFWELAWANMAQTWLKMALNHPAAKHNIGRWNLKKVAKGVLFKASFAVFVAQKEVAEAPNWMQTTLDIDQRCLFII